MQEYLPITTRQSNLLNVVEHDTEDRRLWTYYHNQKWHVTDEKPVICGIDHLGRYHVDVKVKEVFADAESLLTAQRQNGFHSWRDPLVANPNQHGG